MGLVICFAGRIGSGKSSISQAIATQLGFRRVGFSDFLRAELERQGKDPSSREALQNLGELLVLTDPEQFCQNVLDTAEFMPGMDLVVDGIRHVNIHKILVQLVFPSKSKLIFLSADESTRFIRVQSRKDGQTDFSRAETHRVEAELALSLPAIADENIDAGLDFSIVLQQCSVAIGRWRDQSP